MVRTMRQRENRTKRRRKDRTMFQVSGDIVNDGRCDSGMVTENVGGRGKGRELLEHDRYGRGTAERTILRCHDNNTERREEVVRLNSLGGRLATTRAQRHQHSQEEESFCKY